LIDIRPIGDFINSAAVLVKHGISDIGKFSIFKDQEVMFGSQALQLLVTSEVKSSKMSMCVLRRQISGPRRLEL